MGGRVNDVSQFPVAIPATGQLSGSLFISYDAIAGSVSGGVGNVGDSSPSYTGTLVAIQNAWNDELLFPAFFLRSEGLLGGQAWTSGTATAVISNFRVISGSPVAVPEPGGIGLLAWFVLAIPYARRTGRISF
jgi:hypothetical protein